MWTILEELKRDRRWMVRVQCDCGAIRVCRRDHVRRGRTTSCKSCASKRTAKNYPPPIRRTGAGMLSGTHWNAIRHGAKRRDIPVTLTPQEVWELFEKQKGKCALSGIPLNLNRELKNQNVNWDVIDASLDRIDSDKGYIPGNVQWVHKTVNYIKRDLPDKEFINWCSLISSEHLKGF